MRDDPVDHWHREARLNEARWHEAATERDEYERTLIMLCEELMRMPRQSARVENAVRKARARQRWIETHGSEQYGI